MDAVNPFEFFTGNPAALLILVAMAVVIGLVLWWGRRRS
jgi:hypothetical protein